MGTWAMPPICRIITEALQHCTDFLPNVKKLLQLFATLPVTSATPERTFSVLKLFKTYLRAAMTEE